MKKSSATSADLDLTEAFSYSPEEIAALNRAAQHRAMTLEEYLEYCSQFPDATYEQLKNRPGPRGRRFTL